MENDNSALPYPPSWIDRFTDWVDRLPGPWWLFYVVLALVLVLFGSAVQWQAGAYLIGTFHPFHIWFMLNIIYIVALLHYLDKLLEAALKTSRPALDVNDADYANLRYRLTNLPAHPMLIASFAVAIFFFPALYFFAGGQVESLGFSSKPVSLTFLFFFWGLTWWNLGAMFYQMAQQLTLIGRIYSTHIRINLFQLTPLYAFSGVTVRLAIAIAFGAFLWMGTLPQQGNIGALIALASIFVLVAVVVFVLPLWGLHQRLVAEKEHTLNENGRRFETATAALHRDVDAGNLENATRLKDALTGLDIEHNLLQKIPTWPWQPETLRGLITALILPIVVFLIQRLLPNLVGG